MNTTGIDPKTIEFRNNILGRLPKLKNTGECACPPTREFWDYYKNHKQEFYDACFRVFRTANGEWRIKALDLVDRNLVNQQKLDAMKAKHQLVCPDCRESAGICRSAMKDGRMMYQGYCPVCNEVLTTALPHALVSWYVEGGLIIVDRNELGEKSDAN